MSDTTTTIAIRTSSTDNGIDAIRRTLALIEEMTAAGMQVDVTGTLNVRVWAEVKAEEEVS